MIKREVRETVRCQCPHCRRDADLAFTTLGYRTEGNTSGITYLVEDRGSNWNFHFAICPMCGRLVMRSWNFQDHGDLGYQNYVYIYPPSAGGRLASWFVPREYSEDYTEAVAVLAVSAKASAALSRRCLQNILRQVAKVKHGTLYTEIQEAINSGALPPHVSEVLDTFRKLGNTAAHPIRNENTGEIVPVDPEEASWCLDVLDMLFDLYFVAPAKAAEMKRVLGEKMKGKSA
ncbi:MAG: DUF4145 domain-containing protein [Rhodospirillaceae bacterium]|nr:DUF4145 domain-containing protein [Rhodospirillaceae bacterium]